ncbi:MAG: alpha-hydroxy acid oxidase [Acidobacteriota bacterium]
MMEPINLADYEALAVKRLPTPSRDYIQGGSGNQRTLERNCSAFDDIGFRPRCLVDVSQCDLTTELFGTTLPSPILLAPTGFHGLSHPDGEIETARGAQRDGTPLVVSTLASRRLEDIAAATDSPLWFQVYCSRDRGVTEALIRRAADAGFQGLMLTVDTPVLGRRQADERNRFRLPQQALPQNMLDFVDLEALARPEEATSAVTEIVARLFDPTLSWSDLAWLRGLTDLPVVIKGVLEPADATLAIEHGVDGIVVSNHGGRQLDGAPATIEALPAIVDAVDGKCPVLFDGGIRRGADVVRAVALGADAVMIGRPYVWGLAVNGADGVAHVLSLLRRETREVLALLGCPRLRDLGPEHVRLPAAWPV